MDSVVVVHGEVERGLWAGERACHGVKSRMQQQVAAEHAYHGAMGGVEVVVHVWAMQGCVQMQCSRSCGCARSRGMW